ncbi:DUF4168 domain-containing protein [Rhizobium sp. LC145]|uniref:DUF4168 domain-containing protein n=1 Tax=Rhizobium sp. LC145 TaxID=1120688 RepID=UPI0009E45CAD|nr:DUF4168 domain-containing protein [Rhizobium sp. LC145]TKT57365.1 DUF4168 domain-containing protein [Rhizobiaceae bacterium LC148]
MITRNFRPASLSALILSLVFFGNPAFAQEANTQKGPVQGQTGGNGMPAAAVTDQKIEAFAVAYLQVDKVRQEYSTKIGATSDAATKQQLQTEASKKMVQVVEGSPDMSVEEYNAILTAAEKDPALVQRVQDKLQKATPSQQ